jgi:hypothetical protein
VICPKNSVHTGLSFEIFYAELTHKNSGKSREHVVISIARASSISLKLCKEPLKSYYMICRKNLVHTGLSSEIFYAELTHQNSGKYGEDVLILTIRACSISLTFDMEPLKSYYM